MNMNMYQQFNERATECCEEHTKYVMIKTGRSNMAKQYTRVMFI